MGPVIADDDSSDDEVPLAQRMKQEAATPKGALRSGPRGFKFPPRSGFCQPVSGGVLGQL